MSVLRHSTEDHNDAPTSTPYEKKKLCTICNALVSLEYWQLQSLNSYMVVKSSGVFSPTEQNMTLDIHNYNHLPSNLAKPFVNLQTTLLVQLLLLYSGGDHVIDTKSGQTKNMAASPVSIKL